MSGLLESTLAEVVKPLVAEVQSLRQELAEFRQSVDNHMPDHSKQWSYKDAANKLGCKYNTLTGWISKGLIETSNGKALIPDREIRRLIENGNRPFVRKRACRSRKSSQPETDGDTAASVPLSGVPSTGQSRLRLHQQGQG